MSTTPPTPPDFPLPTDSPEDFDDKAYDCFPYVAAAATNAYVNAQAAETAAVASEDSAEEADDSATAAEASRQAADAAANYKGLWSSLSGALNTPATVKHAGAMWRLNVSLANVALSEPSLANSDWAIINYGGQTVAIFNAFSSNGYTSRAVPDFNSNGIISALSGSLTAGVLKNILSLSGTSGTMSHLSVRVLNTTSRQIRVRVTVDGVSVYDALSAAITTSLNGCTVAGLVNAASPVVLPTIEWRESLSIEISSTLTETDKLSVQYVYNTGL